MVDAFGRSGITFSASAIARESPHACIIWRRSSTSNALLQVVPEPGDASDVETQVVAEGCGKQGVSVGG